MRHGNISLHGQMLRGKVQKQDKVLVFRRPGSQVIHFDVAVRG